LVRKLCPKCKKPAHIPQPVMQEIEGELLGLNMPKPYQFFEGRGCPECDQGYKGRIGIFEVLPMTDRIENLAIARKPASEIKIEAIKEGMITMKQDGLIKALKGITTVNEVLRVVTI
jgi:type IV pilus assembly protein PilB